MDCAILKSYAVLVTVGIASALCVAKQDEKPA